MSECSPKRSLQFELKKKGKKRGHSYFELWMETMPYGKTGGFPAADARMVKNFRSNH